MSKFIKLVYAFLVSIALWLIYKLFVEKPQEQQGDEDFNNTTDKTGLSAHDVTILNQTIANLRNATPYTGDDYSVWDVLVPMYGVINATNNLTSARSAYDLGLMLSEVENKQQFSKVFYRRVGVTLDSAIVKGYGEQVYQLMARNVTDFNDFII